MDYSRVCFNLATYIFRGPRGMWRIGQQVRVRVAQNRLYPLKNVDFSLFKKARAKCVPNLDAELPRQRSLHGPPSHQLQPDRTYAL